VLDQVRVTDPFTATVLGDAEIVTVGLVSGCASPPHALKQHRVQARRTNTAISFIAHLKPLKANPGKLS